MHPEGVRVRSVTGTTGGVPRFVLTRLGAGLLAFGLALLVAALLLPVAGYLWSVLVAGAVGITTASLAREWTQRRAGSPPE